jgi:hypothetical protein
MRVRRPHEDDVIAAAPRSDHVRNVLGRILQIGVDDDDSVSIGGVQTGAHRHFLAEIAGKIEHHHASIAGVDVPQQRHRFIATAIVDVDDLAIRRESVQDSRQPTVELDQDRLLVVHGNDHGQRIARDACLRGRMRLCGQNVHRRLARKPATSTTPVATT